MTAEADLEFKIYTQDCVLPGSRPLFMVSIHINTFLFVDAYTINELLLKWKPEVAIEARDNIQMPEFELSEYSADGCPKDTGKYATGTSYWTISDTTIGL